MNLHKLKIQNKKVCYEEEVAFYIYIDNLGQTPRQDYSSVNLTKAKQMEMMLSMLKRLLAISWIYYCSQQLNARTLILHTTMP